MTNNQTREFHRNAIKLVNAGYSYIRAYQLLENKHLKKHKEPMYSCYRQFINANLYYRNERKLRQNNL